MNKYEVAKKSLEDTGVASMKCYGNSMLPILSNPSICFYKRQDEYNIGDIVFCKVYGRYIDAHLVTKKQMIGDKMKYLISNNHGYDNGWTSQIYGRVIKSTDKHGVEKSHG